jgi:putative flippase GtrA
MTSERLRILRFCVVGVTNTLVTLAVYALLIAIGFWAPLASGIAFCAGATNSYQLNRRCAGALASAGGVLVLTHAGWPRLAAECVILPCVTVALYSVSRLLVFRSASV